MICDLCGCDTHDDTSTLFDVFTVSGVTQERRCFDCDPPEPDPNDAEAWCHDCRVPEPDNGWAEEAPQFRLCWDCATARPESDDEVTE